MLVNIWATIVYLSDSYFSGADNNKSASLDLLICEKLHKKTDGKQTWMIHPVWLSPGTTGALLRESYRDLHDAKESYLVLIMPGFADALYGVPIQLVERQLDELGRRARVFNKKIITVEMGIPPKTPPKIVKKIKEVNDVHLLIAHKYEGLVADLRKIPYCPWDQRGSKPENLSQVADIIVETILRSHPSFDAWKKISEKKEV